MKISTNHLKRYKEIGLLLWKYGCSDLVQQMGIDEAVDPQEAKAASAGKAGQNSWRMIWRRWDPLT